MLEANTTDGPSHLWKGGNKKKNNYRSGWLRKEMEDWTRGRTQKNKKFCVCVIPDGKTSTRSQRRRWKESSGRFCNRRRMRCSCRWWSGSCDGDMRSGRMSKGAATRVKWMPSPNRFRYRSRMTGRTAISRIGDCWSCWHYNDVGCFNRRSPGRRPAGSRVLLHHSHWPSKHQAFHWVRHWCRPARNWTFTSGRTVPARRQRRVCTHTHTQPPPPPRIHIFHAISPALSLSVFPFLINCQRSEKKRVKGQISQTSPVSVSNHHAFLVSVGLLCAPLYTSRLLFSPSFHQSHRPAAAAAVVVSSLPQQRRDPDQYPWPVESVPSNGQSLWRPDPSGNTNAFMPLPVGEREKAHSPSSLTNEPEEKR